MKTHDVNTVISLLKSGSYTPTEVDVENFLNTPPAQIDFGVTLPDKVRKYFETMGDVVAAQPDALDNMQGIHPNEASAIKRVVLLYPNLSLGMNKKQ